MDETPSGTRRVRAYLALPPPAADGAQAEYLHANGWGAFFKWFDHTSWYPLGRYVLTRALP